MKTIITTEREYEFVIAGSGFGGSWSGLADRKKEPEPFYELACKMPGAEVNPKMYDSDLVLRKLSEATGRKNTFHTVTASVFFVEPEKTLSSASAGLSVIFLTVLFPGFIYILPGITPAAGYPALHEVFRQQTPFQKRTVQP